MAPNSLIVNVVVTKSTRVVSQQAFGTPAIFGPSDRFGEAYRVYTSAKAMLTDGFMTSDPEYIEANAAFSQPIKPKQIVVSKFTAAVAQVDTFQVGTLVASHLYQFTLDSVIISYMSASSGDTQQIVLAALLAAIATAFPSDSPVTGAVAGSGAGATLTLTAATPGAGFSISAVDVDLTHVAVTANHTIPQDILIAQNAVNSLSQFYGVIVTSHVKSDILQVAAYIESQLLVYVTATADADALNGVSGNVLLQLQAATYDRTMCLYSAQANTNGPDGAWMGYMLPTQPGIGNWAMKTLAGITADNLTDTQINNILSANGNIYVDLGGNGTTIYGKGSGGEYFDVTIFLDWVSSTIQSGEIAVITDPANLKVPYTNPGIALLETPIRNTFTQGETNQGFAPGWTVFGPNAVDVSSADKKARVLNGVGGEAELAGAINQINVNVYVSV